LPADEIENYETNSTHANGQKTKHDKHCHILGLRNDTTRVRTTSGTCDLEKMGVHVFDEE